MNDQPNNPLHGVTLKMMLEYLIKNIGWAEMAHSMIAVHELPGINALSPLGAVHQKSPLGQQR